MENLGPDLYSQVDCEDYICNMVSIFVRLPGASAKLKGSSWCVVVVGTLGFVGNMVGSICQVVNILL